ncbi:hypothetical protein [Bacillus sp. JJ1474]|uniref:hypothetical protein n=1 Tax=Bacillus sp. JJ1474 TaxID=3122955 RepID=UPI00300028A0
MRITFNIANGIQVNQLTADIPDFNSEEFAKKLNNPQTQFVSVGNSGFTKQSLISWNEVTVEAQND